MDRRNGQPIGHVVNVAGQRDEGEGVRTTNGVIDEATQLPEGASPHLWYAPKGEKCQAELRIYVSHHCSTCVYAYEVAELIQDKFPKVDVRLINIHETQATVPETVFATPTYLFNGQIWSLGNPSWEKIKETFRHFV